MDYKNFSALDYVRLYVDPDGHVHALCPDCYAQSTLDLEEVEESTDVEVCEVCHVRRHRTRE